MRRPCGRRAAQCPAGGDDHGTAHRHALRERELDVAVPGACPPPGSRVRPSSCREQLRERLGQPWGRATPSLLSSIRKRWTSRAGRAPRAARGGGRPRLDGARRAGRSCALAGAVDIGIEQADPRPLQRQGDSQLTAVVDLPTPLCRTPRRRRCGSRQRGEGRPAPPGRDLQVTATRAGRPPARWPGNARARRPVRPVAPCREASSTPRPPCRRPPDGLHSFGVAQGIPRCGSNNSRHTRASLTRSSVMVKGNGERHVPEDQDCSGNPRAAAAGRQTDCASPMHTCVSPRPAGRAGGAHELMVAAGARRPGRDNAAAHEFFTNLRAERLIADIKRRATPTSSRRAGHSRNWASSGHPRSRDHRRPCQRRQA